MVKFSRIFFISFILILGSIASRSQVNAVTFGKNRVQFKKFKWQYYQTKNFNVYFNQKGQELAKFVAQLAEAELPQLEAASEYSLQRRANIILYNEFADMQQTNIGLETDILSTGGTTAFVNNKMVVYFDANHSNLKRQVRQGIADIITKNVLFGDDLGEVAGNQTLLDLPKWLTDGYVAYLGENWSTELDDELKAEILSGDYTKFTSFAFKKPLLAGHAFWYFIEEKYKKENVTYFLYLCRVYKKINKASLQITKKKFKDLLVEFMEYQDDKYSNDINRRKAYPKGNYIEGFDISKRLNYYRFNVNPNKKDNSYVVTQFKKGIVRVILNYDYENKTLLKYGVRAREKEMNPSYPIMAWDPKGTRISVVYSEQGKLKLFVYDVVASWKEIRIDLTNEFDQIQDIKYMLDSKTLLISAVKNGHTDIYTYDIAKQKSKQITNDVYDNMDAAFVAFPNKTGIIFASNRPSAYAKTADTVLPGKNRFNIFLITDFGDKPELNQITQLTNLKYGDARFPTQYNSSHFTFISDENGIGNRYAGFFTTKKAGLDTLILIGDEILRNPSQKEVDSTLKVYKKTEIDSLAVVSVSEDSAYSFPLSNYPSSVVESRIAGDKNQVSEVTRQSGDEKILYKLKIDETTLSRRNITAPPSEYAKKLMMESRLTNNTPASGKKNPADSSKKQDDFFQSEFPPDKTDNNPQNNAAPGTTSTEKGSVLESAKLFKYKPLKFSSNYASFGPTSTPLSNTLQTYGGGAGPIQMGTSTPINGLITMGVSDLLDDISINGGLKFGSNFKDNEWLISYQNKKRRIDWGLTYYRNVEGFSFGLGDSSGNVVLVEPGKVFTNQYQVNVAYPFDVTKAIRLTTGIRGDKQVVSSVDPIGLTLENVQRSYWMSHLEYVYDDVQNEATNIWNGLRYKIYMDYNLDVSKTKYSTGNNTFNFGFDGRYYYPIYRNIIWAARAAGNFSWGNQKIIYYLGGEDGWLMFGSNTAADGRQKYFDNNNKPSPDNDYAFQSLAVNMRGFIQNVANGNNAITLNSEFRVPIVSTFFNKTINNPFLRDLQIVQFTDFGTAWNGSYKKLRRPEITYGSDLDPVQVKIKAPGIGAFVGGYGFGVRTSLLGYFVKFDMSWPMNTVFGGRPIKYLALGLDF
ncbi:MAG: hypothetical protein ABI402_19525 [Ferruginibacter sp.]